MTTGCPYLSTFTTYCADTSMTDGSQVRRVATTVRCRVPQLGYDNLWRCPYPDRECDYKRIRRRSP